MAQTGLLVVSNLSRIPSILTNVRSHVSKNLYISFTPKTGVSPLSYSKYITGIYNQSICQGLNVRVLMANLKNPLLTEIQTDNAIDVVMFDDTMSPFDLKDFARTNVSNLMHGFNVINFETSATSSDIKLEPSVEPEGKMYDFVALGGTFDRFHSGHKILLSEGILRANKHLTVGVTDVNMIKSKKLWELIEPVEERIEKLKKFLMEIDPSIEYNVVPIRDMYGPTQDDPRLQLLVVSEETIKGVDLVNKKRKENNLSPMDGCCMKLAGEADIQSEEEDSKISSSNVRMRLLGTVLREPEEKSDLPSVPYVIGLTGGIASGKTQIAERLGKLGAGVINCDLLAHELYKAGQPMNATIAETFGQDVIDSSGEVDRRRLGQIVFNDPARLIELNNLLWPAIINLAKKRIAQLGKEGYRVVVMEAAVLIQANWQNSCHQVWTSIIPQDEAIKRLKERNGLSEAAAKERLDSQPSNVEQVAAANVVFSSFGSYGYTSTQVQKAWDNLLVYLDNNYNMKSKM